MDNIRRVATFVLLLCMATAAQAQFGWQWISSQPMDGVSQLWMRRTYTNLPYTDRATITLASNGMARLYVNGRYVNPDPVAPQCFYAHNSRIMQTFDVSPYIVRTDTLDIALWCASANGEPCAAALRLDAHDKESGVGFTATTDTTWMCRPATVQTDSSGYEWTDGTQWHSTWSYNETDWARWTPAIALKEKSEHPKTEQENKEYPKGACRPLCLTVKAVTEASPTETDKRSVTYAFPHAFMGFVRVTIRDARPGETIFINGMRYICNGTIDEQAIGRFAMLPWRSVTITGDHRFKPEQVQNVEGLEMEAAPQPKVFHHWEE